MPAAFFEEVVSGPGLAVPAAYLLFSDVYADSARQAAGRGWPVTRLPGHHLAMLTEPEAVAATLLTAVGTLTAAAADGGHSTARSNTRCQW